MNLRSLIVALIVALMVVLAGCAIPHRTPDLTPPVLVSETAWQQVDGDIAVASLAATEQVKIYARGSMEAWRDRVNQRTEENFIPWFSSYWTQQWLAVKVTWYKVSSGKETDPAANRLAAYLQEQYHKRVLDPVAKEIDPDQVMGEATKYYVQLLGEQLRGIPQRYGVPLDQFDQRLKGIPAIALAPPAAPSASLYQILHADPITTLPAYVALVDQIRNAVGGAGVGPSDAGISSSAKQVSEQLEAQLAPRGVASAVATAVGRVAGMLISIGAAGIGAVAHESERPKMEAQLRKDLNTAFDEEWLGLMENRSNGVMAAVYHLSGHIEGSLAKTDTLPVKAEPVAREVSLPEAQPLQDEAPANVGSADE